MSETDIKRVEMTPQQLAQACADAMYAEDVACQEMGVELQRIEPGQAVMSMRVRADMLNGHQNCHGGYIFALADSAFAYACNSRNRKVVGVGCKIDYVAPAVLDDHLLATATECFQRGRSGIYDVVVSNQRGENIAFFRGNSRQVDGVYVENCIVSDNQ